MGNETVALGHDYKEVVKEPTCTEGGYTTYTCTRCEDSYVGDETAALGHDYIDHDAQAPTCTEPGWNAYQTCSRCDYTTYEELPATGHTPLDPVVEGGLAPTCESPGSYDTVIYCDVCGEELSRVTIHVDALGHDYDEVVKEPTCTEGGYTTFTCSRCGYSYVGNETAALGHDYEEVVEKPTCTEDGLVTCTCRRCGEETYEVLPATGHTPGEPVRENETAPTCTEPGSCIEIICCAVCGEELSREQKVLDALGHDYIDHDAQAPTCTEPGWAAYQTCSRCGDTTYAELPATGHKASLAVRENEVAATCTEPGRYDTVVYCSVCGAEMSRVTRERAALGHRLVGHSGKSPTCTEPGWAAYQTCTRCDYTTYQDLPALGHTPGEPARENEIAPTCTEPGSCIEIIHCAVCGEELSRGPKVLDALGHDLTDHAGKSPTCTEPGWAAYQTCSRCGYSTYQDLPALGHTPGEPARENEIATTCTEAGSYDEVVRCAVCGEELSREAVVTAALGHTWDSGIVTLEPTETQAGVRTYTCTRCGETRTEIIPATSQDYRVVFDANQGEGSMQDQVIPRNTYEYLTKNAYTRAGYGFAGWNTAPDGSGTAYTDGKRVKDLTLGLEITLYAQWKPNTYNVKYYANGGAGSMPIQSAVYAASFRLAPNAFTRVGYTFAGWNTASNGSGTAYADEETVQDLALSGMKALYAQWTPNGYEVVFDPNGGEGGMEHQAMTYNAYATLTPNVYTRTGYKFAGWNTAADGSGTTYADGKKVRNLASDGTVTLYARWKPNTYTIRYYPNGGTGSMAAKSMTYDVPAALTRNAFLRTGYSFTGWNTKADGTGEAYEDRQTVQNLAPSGTKTLYAQWAPNNYEIVFNPNGGEGVMENQIMTYNTSAALTANAFTRTGYSFLNWNTAADGSGLGFANGKTVKNLVSGGKFTLYAQWKPHTYNVKFYSNGGTGSMPSQLMTYGVSTALNANVFTRTGYSFVGWNTAADGSGTAYTDGRAVKDLAVSGTAYLFAQWKPNTYNVKFYANGGAGSMLNQSMTYGVSAALSENGFTRTGYSFSGWNTAADGSGTAYAAGSTVKNMALSGTVYLFAQWTPNRYEIAFDPNGGEGSMDAMPMTYGEYAALSPNAFTRSGYAFSGWNTAADGSGTTYTNGKTVRNLATEGTVTLYAQWAKH